MDNCGVHGSKYKNHTIHMDMATELMEEEEAVTMRPEAWLTEVKLEIEGKPVLTLIDTGSEVSVIAEHVLNKLRETNKNIPSLPVAGVTIVGITGVRSKRVTTQVQLNMLINGENYENTFLVCLLYTSRCV